MQMKHTAICKYQNSKKLVSCEVENGLVIVSQCLYAITVMGNMDLNHVPCGPTTSLLSSPRK